MFTQRTCLLLILGLVSFLSLLLTDSPGHVIPSASAQDGLVVSLDMDTSDGPCTDVDVSATHKQGDDYYVAICVRNLATFFAVAAFQFDVLYDDTANLAFEVLDSGDALDDNPDANAGATTWGDGLGGGWDCSWAGGNYPTGDKDPDSGPGQGDAYIRCVSETGPYTLGDDESEGVIALIHFEALSIGVDTMTIANGQLVSQYGGEMGSCNPVGEQPMQCDAGTVTVTDQAFEASERRITTNMADQYDPAISGDLIVWADDRGADADIWYYDLVAEEEVQVTSMLGDQQLSDVSGPLIVFTTLATFDVILYSTLTHEFTNLTETASTRAMNPAIAGSLVAWEDNRAGDVEIFAKDLSTGEERRISSHTAADWAPAVSGGAIVWQRCASGTCDIFAYDWASGLTRQITGAEGDERNPDIYGDTVVYDALRAGERYVCSFDLTTSDETCLSSAGMHNNPSVSGEFVAFEDASTGTYHIRLWHLPSGLVFDLTASPGAQYLNDIDGNRVVYTDDRDGQLDIYMTEFVYTPLTPVGGIAELPEVTDAAAAESAAPAEKGGWSGREYALAIGGLAAAVLAVAASVRLAGRRWLR